MLRLLAAAAAATAASTSPPLVSTAPWWEKVTVTVADDGKAQSCRYESSLNPAAAKDCEVVGKPAALGAKGELTRLTFERRFQPGPADLGSQGLPAGDTLLGRQVMALSIDAKGAVNHCQVVSKGGELTPDYGCAEAAAERFQASLASAADEPRKGYMTILVYGHAEQMA